MRFIKIISFAAVISIFPFINQAFASDLSIEETMDWIIAKHEGNSCSRTQSDDAHENSKISIENKLTHNYIVETQRISAEGSIEYTMTRKLSLADIDNVSITHGWGCYLLDLNSEPKAFPFSYAVGTGTPTFNETSGTASMFFISENVANRVKNAFEHAIKLAKDDEPF